MKLLEKINLKTVLGILISLCVWLLINEGNHWGLLYDRIEVFLYDYRHLIFLFSLAFFLFPLFFKEDNRILIKPLIIFTVILFLLTYLILLLINIIKIPELIFGIITLVLTAYLVWNFFLTKKDESLKVQISKIIVSALLIAFSWIWFVPIYIGQKGEIAICKFRFQILEYDHHDYNGYGDLADLFIKLRPNKYGRAVFYKKVGGWKEYIGLKKYNYQTYEEYFGKEKEW